MDNLKRIKGSFPHGVKNIQGQKLYELTTESTGVIVEIGSFVGKSTIYMALGSMAGNNYPIVAIDPWKKGSTKETFMKHIEMAKVSHLVFPVQEYSHIALQKYHDGMLDPSIPSMKSIGLLFVDGAHSHQALKLDFQWIPLVRKGGIVVFHDYCEKLCPGVAIAIDEFFVTNEGVLEVITNVGTLLICKKV